MPAGRVCMRQVREIVRLGYTGVSKHQISRRTGVVPSTVRETLKRFAASGLTWPLGDEVTDTVLETRMYRNAGKKQGHRQYAEPDWAWVHRELKRKHVTLSILWDEYIAQHPDGYRYSRYVAAVVMWLLSAIFVACWEDLAYLTQHKSELRLVALSLFGSPPWIICLLSAPMPINTFKTHHSPTSGPAICATVPHMEQRPRP